MRKKAFQWQSTKICPELKLDEYDNWESARLLVVVNGRIAFGCARNTYDKKWRFHAEGYSGDWDITHWCYLPKLPRE